MDEPSLDFGTESLRDDAARLTKIYLSVKGGTFGNDDYKHTGMYCGMSDIDIIDFFTKQLGNKRLAVVALLCAGFSLIQDELSKFSVSVYDIAQVFARISLIQDVDYLLMEETTLNIFVHERTDTVVRRVTIYIPEVLWGMLYGVSLTLKIRFSSFILYLLRTGIVEYNNFTNRFSSTPIDIPYEYISIAERWKTAFTSGVAVKYNDLFGRIKYLYDTYGDILDDGHKDLKEEMKRIIDKST